MIANILAAAKDRWDGFFSGLKPVPPGVEHNDRLIEGARRRLDALVRRVEDEVGKIGDIGVEAVVDRYAALDEKDRGVVRDLVKSKRDDEEVLRMVKRHGETRFGRDAAGPRARAAAVAAVTKRFGAALDSMLASILGPVERWAAVDVPVQSEEGKAVVRPLSLDEDGLRIAIKTALWVLAVASSAMLCNYLISSGSPLFTGFVGAWILAPATATFPFFIGVALSAWLAQNVRVWDPALAKKIVLASGAVLVACFVAWLVAVSLGYSTPAPTLLQMAADPGLLDGVGGSKTNWSPLLVGSEVGMEVTASFLLRSAYGDLMRNASPTLPDVGSGRAELAAEMAASAAGLVGMLAMKESTASAAADALDNACENYLGMLTAYFIDVRSPPTPPAAPTY